MVRFDELGGARAELGDRRVELVHPRIYGRVMYRCLCGALVGLTEDRVTRCICMARVRTEIRMIQTEQR